MPEIIEKEIDYDDLIKMIEVVEKSIGAETFFAGKVLLDNIEYTYSFPYPIKNALLRENEEEAENIRRFVLENGSFGIYSGIVRKINERKPI